MRHRKYAHPTQVRLFTSQELVMNEMFRDRDYCLSKGFYSTSDFIRNSLNEKLKDYEMYNFRKSVS